MQGERAHEHDDDTKHHGAPRFILNGAILSAIACFPFVLIARCGATSAQGRLEAAVDLAAGKDIFAAICAPCHGANAGGTVGPNLTDEYWLHGGRPENILTSVRDGWGDQGMPAWGRQLGEGRGREVGAYVVGLTGTHAERGKAPQGTMACP